MKNLKVGAKIILGFGIVIALLLVITATVFVSNTSSLNNIANVKDITELKQVCNTLKTEFMEARIQANILYVRISDDAYNKFTALADSLEIGFADAIEFSSQNKGLEMYQATLEENYEVFASWRQSVEQVHTFSDRRSQLQTKLNDVSLRMMDQGQVIYDSQINAIAREISGGSDDAVLLYRTSRVDMTQRMKVGIATANISGMKLQQTFDSALAPDTLKQLDDVVEIVWEYRDSRDPEVEAESANVAAMVSAIRVYQDAVREYANICDKSDQVVNDAKEKGIVARDLIEKALAEMDTDVNSAIEVTSDSASSSRVITLVAALISVLIAVFMAFLITIGITRPLKFLAVYIKSVADTGNVGLREENKEESEFYSTYKDEIGDTVKAANNLFELMKFQGDVLQRIADKDLDHHVELRSTQCTIGLIATDLLDQLNSVMAAIQDSSRQVSVGSRQIADEALALAQGATEQAASVEELSASVTEVAGKIRENAEKAVCASDLALTIKGNAEKGNAQMESMMRAVEEINQACQSISKVIKVIDDIAFQTNILALNASVEAARAGQHGKGFAVVADEVRSLASKSAEAAKSTDRLIADSITKAEFGLKTAVETSASFSEIISGINENSQIVSAIAKVAEEQSSAVSQINEGINLVAKVVQQNSAASEESAAASQEMDSQAKILAQIASQFKLRQNAENSQKAPQATSSAGEGFAISVE